MRAMFLSIKFSLKSWLVALSHQVAAGALIPLASLLLCGCGYRPPQNPFSQEVVDRTGTNMLALVYVPVGSSSFGRPSYDFHSIVWRTKDGTNWNDRIVISQFAFQTGYPRRRWVTEVASLDSAQGTAIIKVAEEAPPVATNQTVSINVFYSWREWNLLTNSEVRVLRMCQDPFEKY